jgi:8-oxo-dGTP diphosphatase
MTVQIVMAVLIRGDEFLLCHRHPDREWYPDVWDLPGGHVEDGEEPHVALARELAEELGITVEPDPEPLLGVSFDDIDAQVWRITNWRGEVQNTAPHEHDAIAWFSPADLADLSMAAPAIGELCRLAVEAD